MGNHLSLDQIVQAVRRQFRNGPPNGWHLGWDEGRYFSEIQKATAPWAVTNCTTFDYGFCNTYELALEAQGAEYKLTVLISFIVPVYCQYWTKLGNQTVALVSSPPNSCSEIAKEIASTLEGLGLAEFPDPWSEVNVEGVPLELSEGNEACLEKCLFRDFAVGYTEGGGYQGGFPTPPIPPPPSRPLGVGVLGPVLGRWGW